MTELWTVKEAAAAWKVHPKTVLIWIRKGLVPHLRFSAHTIRGVKGGDPRGEDREEGQERDGREEGLLVPEDANGA